MPVSDLRRKSIIAVAEVVENRRLCREHFRLRLRLPEFPPAKPGQFVHLGQASNSAGLERANHDSSGMSQRSQLAGIIDPGGPLLRRAFSIAGLSDGPKGVEIDVIYRVVGTATRWMNSLHAADPVSVMGPQGNHFPIHLSKPGAWVVAGGVGLPPMLWLSHTLAAAGKRAVAFCGAQSADLLAVTLDLQAPPASDASCATLTVNEFASHGVPAILSTDDGTLGFRGHIGGALTAYHKHNPPQADALVMYTCGPERMMRFVAEFCIERGIECYVCMERNMACGTGLCQSCVVPVQDADDAEAWRYRLCCTEGPIFAAGEIIWE